jgi:glycosyltransferase involved in cell wall biosynthesis
MKNTTPLISIIIPCYNVSGYVENAVTSILNQSYTNLEIFIIDDASTDDTLQKIKRFQDARIKVIAFKENTQKVGAVNEVLKKVSGDFIAFQDADDWSDPERIILQVKEFPRDPELGICFTNYRYIAKKPFLPKKISITNEELRNEFLNYNLKRESGNFPTICGTMMISKQALDKTGGYHPFFKGRVGEDIHWVYRILKDFKGVTINERLYNYRIRTGSFTQIQASGIRPKYSYSLYLLQRIIYKDIHERIDVFHPGNCNQLRDLELDACEEALKENVRLSNETRKIYEESTSFRLGKMLLTPVRLWNRILATNLLKKMIRNENNKNKI